MNPEWVGAALIVLVCLIADRRATRSTHPDQPETGPKWEQDVPYALMLDDLDEDPS